MRAITIRPGQANSVALAEVPEPAPAPGEALLQTVAVGVCGTDREILAGAHGAAPPGSEVLIPGHECLARVVRAPEGCGLAPEQLVVPTVRRPCGRPECYPCAHDHPDMCVTLAYSERGIQGANGYQCERFVESPRWLVPVPAALQGSAVLLEPTSVVVKAVEEAARVQRARLAWHPRTALVTGAGPVGLLGAMLLRLRGLEVTVYDRLPLDSVKARAAASLGARYACAEQLALGDAGRFDWILECTGAPPVVFSTMGALAPCGVLCLLGVSGTVGQLQVPGAALNRQLVLTNGLVFGSVNASREAFAQGVQALAAAEAAWPGWLGRLITRRVTPERVRDAVTLGPDDIKAIVEWATA
jgi:threonine dehydrogenase-like Zn-dependent dehydrogenase